MEAEHRRLAPAADGSEARRRCAAATRQPPSADAATSRLPRPPRATAQLEPLTGELGLDRLVPDAEVATPGPRAGRLHRPVRPRPAARAGRDRDHLPRLARSGDRAAARSRDFFRFDLPCVFVTKGLDVPPELLELARATAVPVLRTPLKTAEFYRRIKPILEDAFAPRTTLHGSLADVYGVGPPVHRALGHRQERVRARPGGARAPAGGRRRRAGDAARHRRPDRPGPRAGGAPHGDPRHRADRHPGAVRRPRGAPAEAHRGGGAARGLGDGAGDAERTGLRAADDRDPRRARSPRWSCRSTRARTSP